MLRSADPPMLERYSPRMVNSDGNCFYRAMSLALFGTQGYHDYLRVQVALEMINNPGLYTCDSDTFVCHGLPVLTPDFRQLLRDTVTNASYAELVHIFALSKALSIPVQSYACPTATTPSMHPYTLFVNKAQYVRSVKPGFVTVMWTFSDSANMTEPNHFVLLVPYHASTHLTAPTTSSPSATTDVDADTACQETAPVTQEVEIQKTRRKRKRQATTSASPRPEPDSRQSIKVLSPTM